MTGGGCVVVFCALRSCSHRPFLQTLMHGVGRVRRAWAAIGKHVRHVAATQRIICCARVRIVWYDQIQCPNIADELCTIAFINVYSV